MKLITLLADTLDDLQTQVKYLQAVGAWQTDVVQVSVDQLGRTFYTQQMQMK